MKNKKWEIDNLFKKYKKLKYTIIEINLIKKEIEDNIEVVWDRVNNFQRKFREESRNNSSQFFLCC